MSKNETYIVLLNLEPSTEVHTVGLVCRPVDVLLSRLGPVADLGESLSSDFDLLNSKSNRADNLTMLVGIGLQSAAESSNLLGQVVGDGRSDSGDNVVGKAEDISNQTGSWGSKDCRA